MRTRIWAVHSKCWRILLFEVARRRGIDQVNRGMRKEHSTRPPIGVPRMIAFVRRRVASNTGSFGESTNDRKSNSRTRVIIMEGDAMTRWWFPDTSARYWLSTSVERDWCTMAPSSLKMTKVWMREVSHTWYTRLWPISHVSVLHFECLWVYHKDIAGWDEWNVPAIDLFLTRDGLPGLEFHYTSMVVGNPSSSARIHRGERLW